MRKQTVVLMGVFLVSVLGAGIIAEATYEHQQKIAATRAEVKGLPIAGFQKFAADIHWMMFIQYGGSHDVNEDTAEEFYNQIMTIIRLDPDFERAYYLGVLMLGPVDLDLALEIANKGLENPRVRDNWRLPMLAGQFLMNREKMKYYNGEPMDRDKLLLAKYYFRHAMNTPDASGIAQRSYVRALAAVQEGDDPLEVKEITAWYAFWQESRERDYYSMAGNPESDISQILLNQMRIAIRRYPDNPRVHELVDEIVTEAFPRTRLDPVSLMPYDPGDRYSPHSGAKVEVYGVCLACGAVLKGKYCHLCGEDSQPASPAANRQGKPSKR